MANVLLENLDLTFRVRTRKQWSLKAYLIGLQFLRSPGPVRKVRALAGIDLELGQGSRLGVIGSNGAGKTTLLRTIAGIYPPTSGNRQVDGRICSLFELSVGFELEATGWDNILYRSLLMGATPRCVRHRRDEIAEFTELGQFLEVPIKYYSSGMLMRLAFAISTALDPEILLVDECLNVGDQDFRRKAHDRIRTMIDKASLLLLVSHELDAIRDLCTRVIWLDHGRIVADGPTDQILDAYTNASCNGSESLLAAR